LEIDTMTKLGPDFFSAFEGETIVFTVEAVGMASNAALDPLLNPVIVNRFNTTGKFTMGNADQTIVISYGFPDNPPDVKYRRTIATDDLTNGPFDVTKPTGKTRTDLSYNFQFAGAQKPAAAANRAKGARK
jgi:hypothetical protein